MSSRSDTIMVDDDTISDSYFFVSVRKDGVIHVLHNSYEEMSRDMRPFRNWMRCIDAIPGGGETYEECYLSLHEKVFNPAEEVVRMRDVVEAIDTIRNSRNRSNKKCIDEVFSSFRKRKIFEDDSKIRECQYSLGRILEDGDGEVLYGFIMKDNSRYRFEISFLSFSGIVKRRSLSGKFEVVPSGRYAF